jgi:hypothetical protein
MIKIYEHSVSKGDVHIATLSDKSILPVLARNNTIILNNTSYQISSVNTIIDLDYDKENFEINIQVFKLG